MKHIFAAIADAKRIPVAGDLIRSRNTGDLINIVLQVYGPVEDKDWLGRFSTFYSIRSVRYARVNGRDLQYLGGTRSRRIKWDSEYRFNTWEIVEEYAPLDNKRYREQILENLRDVQTSYQPPEIEEDKDDKGAM